MSQTILMFMTKQCQPATCLLAGPRGGESVHSGENRRKSAFSEIARERDQATRRCLHRCKGLLREWFPGDSNFRRDCNWCSGQQRPCAAATARTAKPPQTQRRSPRDSAAAAEIRSEERRVGKEC